MIKFLKISILFFILFGCQKTESKKQTVKKGIADEVNDTIIIQNLNAIIYEPTDRQIEQSKKQLGEEDFYIAADDNLYYLNEAYKFLELQKVRIVKTKKDKIIKFISLDKSVTIIDLKKENEILGIYLFDPNKKPKKMDITSAAAFKEYMGR